ncbi:MAG TPA: phosphatase PAP2 family protein [Kribbella sp.]|nr:phosphatase PAP2 family protein [Kribbella sp.]
MRRSSGLSLATLSAGIVAMLAVWIVEVGSIPGEERLLIWIYYAGGTTLERLAQFTNDITELAPLAALTGVLLTVVVALRRWMDAAVFVVGVGVVWAVNPLLKEIVGRSRPDMWPQPETVSQYGFPAGHAANTAAVVAIVVLLLRVRRRQVIWLAVGGVILVIVGLSQLVLGLHYPSDLVAGWLWAFAWIGFVHNMTKGGPG